MKLLRAGRLDSIDDYAIVEALPPCPAAGEVVVRVAACGMGYVDALLARGGYQVKPPLPFTPGQEVSGTIAALGDGVDGFAVGDRVMAFGFGGGLAELAAYPAASVLPIPAAMTFAQAAVFRVNYLTAIHALVDRGTVAPGERVLVFGAAGGVGTAAVQVAALLGAEVIAVGSTPEKRAFATAHGAAHGIDTDVEGWRDRLKALTGGGGVDVVVDPVCGPLFEAAFRSLAWRGRHLVVGFAGGPFPKLPVNLPLMKGAALTGVDVRQFELFEPGRARMHLTHLLDWAGQGRLSPPVGRRFAFENAREAMLFAGTGGGLGKAVIDVADA